MSEEEFQMVVPAGSLRPGDRVSFNGGPPVTLGDGATLGKVEAWVSVQFPDEITVTYPSGALVAISRTTSPAIELVINATIQVLTEAGHREGDAERIAHRVLKEIRGVLK